MYGEPEGNKKRAKKIFDRYSHTPGKSKMLNGPKVNAFFFFFACNDMICMYMIYSLVETSITIGEQ